MVAVLSDVARKAKDFNFFRELAACLHDLPLNDWTEWEWDWLAAMASKPASYEASEREREKLAQIYSYSESYFGHDGITVEQMVKNCHRYHLDFSEEDCDFIVELYQRNAKTVRKRQLRRLVRLYSETGQMIASIALAPVEEPA